MEPSLALVTKIPGATPAAWAPAGQVTQVTTAWARWPKRQHMAAVKVINRLHIRFSSFVWFAVLFPKFLAAELGHPYKRSQSENLKRIVYVLNRLGRGWWPEQLQRG